MSVPLFNYLAWPIISDWFIEMETKSARINLSPVKKDTRRLALCETKLDVAHREPLGLGSLNQSWGNR